MTRRVVRSMLLRGVLLMAAALPSTMALAEPWRPVNTGLENVEVLALAQGGGWLYAGTTSGLYRREVQAGDWRAGNQGLGRGLLVQGLTTIEDTLYLSSDVGLFRSNDNGASWSSAGLLGTDVMTCARLGTRLYAGTWAEGVLVSDDDGDTWSEFNDGLETPGWYPAVNSLLPLGRTLYAAVGDYETAGALYRLEENASSWEKTGPDGDDEPFITLATTGDRLYASTDTALYVSMDAGDTWAMTGLRGLGAVALVESFGSLFAGTLYGGVFTSDDRGVSWSTMNDGLPDGAWVTSLVTADGRIYAGTDAQGVYSRMPGEVTAVSALGKAPIAWGVVKAGEVR